MNAMIKSKHLVNSSCLGDNAFLIARGWEGEWPDRLELIERPEEI